MTINNRLSKSSKKSILKDTNYIYDICVQYADIIATYSFWYFLWSDV